MPSVNRVLPTSHFVGGYARRLPRAERNRMHERESLSLSLCGLGELQLAPNLDGELTWPRWPSNFDPLQVLLLSKL